MSLPYSNLRGAGARVRALLRFDLAPLAHPLFWSALGVLLVNDNLLKGSGIVPGWLTGKLSDFAFLIAAPAVCSALLPRGLPARRALAIGSVVGLFVVTDLSPAASDAVVAAAARLHLQWRLWPDPTDLLALAVLPWTARLLNAPGRSAAAASRSIAWRSRAGLVVGALACLATSAPPEYPHRPFFLNKTGSTAQLRVTWVLSQVDCETTPRALAQTLEPGDLDDPVTHAVPSGEIAVLDGPLRPGPTPVGQCHLADTHRSATRCVAAILEAGSARPVLVVAQSLWYESASGQMFSCSASDPVSKCERNLGRNANPGRDAVVLVGSGDRLAFDGHRAEPETEDDWRYVLIGDVDLDAIAMRASGSASCRTARERYRALREQTACVTDADCVALDAVPVPGDEGDDPCTVYLNRSASRDELRDLRATWLRDCTWSLPSCPTRQPAVCRDGTCSAVCPGVFIPTCPPRCNAGIDLSEGCTQYVPCLNEAGEQCDCDRTPVCRPMSRAARSCPLTCLPPADAPQSGTAGGGAEDDAGSFRGP